MRKGNLQTLGFFLLFVFVLFSLSEASTFIENKDEPFSFQNSLAQGEFERSQKIFELTHASYLAGESGAVKEEESVDVYGFKGKSVKKAFLYSLIVPGSGEFYAGSKIKAAVFLGLDVAFWSFFLNYGKKGKAKEDDYEAFANSYWDKDVYLDWWAPLPDTVKEKYTHTLPDEPNQQYYEMIGKYKQFAFAWKDFDPYTAGEDSLTPYRNRYLDLRYDSNQLLNKAKYSAMFLLGNRILSAFDAALTVKRYNKRGEKFSQVEFKMRLVERNQELIPRLSATLRF
jgi:hypothetical protein